MMISQETCVNQTSCQIVEIHYLLPETHCDRCERVAARFTTAERTAIDIDFAHPVLLRLAVSVHHCPACHHYFRAQPPFLRRDAIYTNQVIHKAVQSVYQDGMAMRRVAERMARDFWVRPSEGAIRGWCREYSSSLDFAGDYQPWVVSEFSGVLCVDEVYQDRLALLLAVDPATSDSDRLVGYQLIHGTVQANDVEGFLQHLKEIGIEPDEVITDGSQLYPAVLAKVWPQAAHQLCLFHETRRITRAVMKVIRDIHKQLPHPPPSANTLGGGPLRPHPPQEDATHPATQRWYWRQLHRHKQQLKVYELAQQGLSQRAIARQTGHHRQTVKGWLAQGVPVLPVAMPMELSGYASDLPLHQRRSQKQRLKRRVHSLAAEGLSYSAIARQVGIHRITVSRWLRQEPPPVEEARPSEPEEEKKSQVPPPVPWSSWEQVRQVREALREHRYLLLRHPRNLSEEEQLQMEALFSTPVGAEVYVAWSFLAEWYRLWFKEDGQRQCLAEARNRYERWRTNSAYRAVPHLRRVLDQMTEAKFESLSQFLRHPEWEATNNGAERAGRAFRHRQAPHFNLRKRENIENAIDVAACLHKEAALRPKPEAFHSCQRGRHPRQEPLPV